MPILVESADVSDGVLEKSEVKWGVRRVWANDNGGPSVMRVKHLKLCLAEARSEKYPGNSMWWIVAQNVKLNFKTGEIAMECKWATVVLIPKGGG